MDSLDLRSKTIVVTGASRGLGAGFARVAARAGASLALCSRGLSALGDSERVLTAQLDVTDASAIAVFAAKTFQRFGHVDLWINNAGLLEPIGPLRDSDSAALQRLLEVNVLGVAHGCRAYVRELRQRGAHGTVINLSSGAARTPFYGWSMYCASKAAVDRLSETLALEEAPGLRVYSIAPGVIDTEMQAAIREKTPAEFRNVHRFRDMLADGQLIPPEAAAAKLLRFAFDPNTPRSPVCVDLR